MGGHGAFGPPLVRGPAPTYPPYKKKNGKKSAIFGFLYFCSLNPPTPPQQKIIWCSYWKNLVLRLVKIYSGVKIHAIFGGWF